jgi:DNA repair protein RadC
MRKQNPYQPKFNNKSIKEWREDDRPREKLMLHGPSTLSDAELLAILISGGTPGYSALDMARDLLDLHQNLEGIIASDYSSYKQIKGMGDAKAVTLAAAFELGKRSQPQSFDEKFSVTSPEDLAKIFIPRFYADKTEKFRVLLLNASNQITREVVVSEGTLTASIVHPREVFKIAISESSASIILMHNHPSGNPKPSRADIELTKQIVKAGDLLDIKVLDHLIIAGSTYTSFVKEGLM